MLIDPDEEQKIEDVIAALVGVLGVQLVGRDIINIGLGRSMQLEQGGLSFIIDDAFLAGKAVQVLGENIVRAMTIVELREWGKSNVYTPQEVITLNGLKNDAEMWLKGRAEAWQQKTRLMSFRSNQEYQAALGTSSPVDAAGQVELRRLAKGMLTSDLVGLGDDMRADLDKLIQTELANSFQQGQAMQIPPDSWVYKIPQPTACVYCFRIHLNPDGSPRLYKLSEVMGRSNYGQPAYTWQFVIGATHPHCYCILRTVKGAPPGGSNEMFASLRKLALAPKKK